MVRRIREISKSIQLKDFNVDTVIERPFGSQDRQLIVYRFPKTGGTGKQFIIKNLKTKFKHKRTSLSSDLLKFNSMVKQFKKGVGKGNVQKNINFNKFIKKLKVEVN